MLPSGLPTPNRSGQDEEFESHIWHATKDRGAARLRIPLDGSKRGWMLNEFGVSHRQLLESTRLVVGSDKFVLVMLKEWLGKHR